MAAVEFDVTPAPDDEDETDEGAILEDRKEARDGVSGVLDDIEPRFASREWVIGDREQGVKYTQQPLGFFAKIEWTAFLADNIDDVIQSEGGPGVALLFGSLMDGSAIQVTDGNAEAATFVSALAKLGSKLPDFLKETYCISLGIPRHRREWAKACMSLPESEGGLSDEDGMLILETFLDQNVKSIKDFFAQRGPKILSRLMTRMGSNRPSKTTSSDESAPKASSKPSKRSAKATAAR